MRITVLVLLLCLGRSESKSDFDVLVEFRNGIEEDPSGHLASTWTTANSPSGGCSSNWYGVQCDGGRIASITLSSMGLVGEINFSALAQLEMLRNFSVSHNRLTGVLPRELGSMRSLEQLDLSDNLFSGPIPTELTNIGSLVYLNLSSNNLSGIFPLGFRKLGRLTHLDLRANDISGDVEGCLAELQNPVHVDLSQNAFSGSLSSLSDNSTLVSSIQYLSVSHNKLSGKLFPQGVPLFDRLEVFDASHNLFEGHIPLFNFLVSLRVLRLSNNIFLGSLPEALLQESSMVLVDLDLSSNNLEGKIGSITSMSLKTLNISSNKLSGPLPAKVGNCAIIDLSNNMISGNVSSIHDWGNYVESIDLSSNSLTGSLPNETSLFLRLTSFKVSNNMLQGEIPFVLGTYPELKVIDMSVNKFYGSLPESIFTSLRVSELNLSGNSFIGSIPFPNTQTAIPIASNAPSYSILNYSLVSMDLSNNLLSGSLSEGISAFRSLKLLNIGRNNISGTIPPQISILRSLIILDLSCNHLEGNIPNNLSEDLVGFNISYNDLSGAVPDSLLRFPDSSFHPGNALLVFPDKTSTNVPDLVSKRRHLKPLIRNILIVALVGSITVIFLLSLLIYYRASLAKSGVKDADKNSPLTNIFALQRPTDPPALSLSQNRLLSLGSDRMSPEHGDITLADKGPVKSGRLELPKGEPLGHVISSPSERQPPFSLFSASPHSKDQGSSGQPSAFKVCSPDHLAGDLHLFDNSFVFTAEELSRAPAEIIGRSCHGTTYKATLDNGHMVTVKWLREGISKSKKEFAREAKKLGNIRHPSIISLRGYYWGPREHERLIISDYVNAECLTAHLCDSEPRKLQPLSLNQRLTIAIDTARSLNYLHSQRAIPHGNLKSTNVILQPPSLNALLSDYSLHRIMNPAGMAEQVLNAGALGYRPPEFAGTSKPCPSLKSDVYAFGVILLELLTGKNAGEIVSGNPCVVDLTDWVRLLTNENRTFECFDKVIPGVDSDGGPPKVLEDMLQVALRCIRSASDRPEISAVFEDLSALTLTASTCTSGTEHKGIYWS